MLCLPGVCTLWHNCSGNPRSGVLCAHLASHRLLMTGGHCWTEDRGRNSGRRGDRRGVSRGGRTGDSREKGQEQRVSMSTGTCAQNIVNKMQEGEGWERQQSRGNRDSAERHDRETGQEYMAERQRDRQRGWQGGGHAVSAILTCGRFCVNCGCI